MAQISKSGYAYLNINSAYKLYSGSYNGKWRSPHIDSVVESSWNVIAHGDAREGKWRGNWRREWVASTLHTTSEHGVSSVTTADAPTSAASSRLNWRPRRFKWTRPFRRKTKYGFWACAITFQTQSNNSVRLGRSELKVVLYPSRSQWLRGLRRGSTASRLLGLCN